MTNWDYKDLFTEEDMVNAFRELEDLYFNHNFGSFSKTQMDTLMFRFYYTAVVKKVKQNNQDKSEFAYSDYKIGSALGLTPSRVRNLRLRMDLAYPDDDFDWKAELVALMSAKENLHIENEWLLVTVTNPNLFNAIKDAIEENHGYVDITLNSSLLRVKQSAVLSLLEIVAGKETIDQFQRDCKKIIREESNLSDKLKNVVEYGDAGLSIATNLFAILKELPVIGKFGKISESFIKIIMAIKQVV